MRTEERNILKITLFEDTYLIIAQDFDNLFYFKMEVNGNVYKGEDISQQNIFNSFMWLVGGGKPI